MVNNNTVSPGGNGKKFRMLCEHGNLRRQGTGFHGARFFASLLGWCAMPGGVMFAAVMPGIKRGDKLYGGAVLASFGREAIRIHTVITHEH